MDPFSSEPGSQASFGHISTGLRDHLGTRGDVRFLPLETPPPLSVCCMLSDLDRSVPTSIPCAVPRTSDSCFAPLLQLRASVVRLRCVHRVCCTVAPPRELSLWRCVTHRDADDDVGAHASVTQAATHDPQGSPALRLRERLCRC